MMIEFPLDIYGDMREEKVVKRYGLHFQNDRAADPEEVQTQISIYFSHNEQVYTLAREVVNIFDIETYLSQRCQSSRFKIELEDIGTEPDTELEFIYSETEFIPYGIK
jgi:hypothetical protein